MIFWFTNNFMQSAFIQCVTAGFIRQAFTKKNVLLDNNKLLQVLKKWKINMSISKITEANFFNCYLTVPQPILGHHQGDSLTAIEF